jgi:hypothetical protein
MMSLLTFFTTFSLLFAGFGAGEASSFASLQPQQAHAQLCTEIGNLTGYITVENLPEEDDQNVIWVSSINDPWSGGPSYAVEYNRQLDPPRFTGVGWNGALGVWIDFDYGTTDEALVRDSNGDPLTEYDEFGNPISGFAWGYWDGVITGLDNVSYSNEDGEFVVTGSNPRSAHCPSGTCEDDVEVGFGDLYFDSLSYNESPAQCPENVDVFVDGASQVNVSCNDNVQLQWTTENVVEDSCMMVDNGAPWPASLTNPIAEQELGGIPSGSITTSNSPATFMIQCEGSISGNTVSGQAYVTCGDTTIDPPTGDPGNNGEFIFEEN